MSGRTDLSWYLDVSIITVGSRVAVLTQNALMRDYDTTALTTTAQDVPAAAARLAGTGGGTGGTAGGTDPVGPTNAAGVPTSIPDTFPLDAGWDLTTAESPRSIVAPSRSLAPQEISTLCEAAFRWPAYEDHLVAGFHNPEDGRDRTLLTFKDADAAVAATQAIVAYYQRCPQHASQPDGYVAHYAVERSSTSGDSWQLSQYNTYNGAPALGAEATEVVRVGLSVLVIRWGGEGDRDSLPDYFTTLEQQAAEPIAALCRFTVDGC